MNARLRRTPPPPHAPEVALHDIIAKHGLCIL